MLKKLPLFILAGAIACIPATPLFSADVPVKSPTGNGAEWGFKYDEQGRLMSMRDPGGRETTLDYEMYPDDRERLKSVTHRSRDGEIVYEFDRQGRLIGMKDLEGIVAYTYDEWGRLRRVKRQGASAVTYTHDRLNRITSLQVGDDYRIEYAYDFLARLETMKTPAGVITYEYRPGQGQVVRSLPNGVRTFWKRQANGQIEEITHGYFEHPDATSYTRLARYTYTHGPGGRIATIREQSPRGDILKRYDYDVKGRLIGATDSGGRQFRYEYDLVGNRTKATTTGEPDRRYSYDWAGRLTSIDGKPCTYDACGNLTGIELDGIPRHYRFFPDNRLAEARVGEETVRYRYDGHGRLVARQAGEEETRFTPDPLSPYWQPLVIQESNNSHTFVIWHGAVPIATMRNDETEWFLHDHLGSVRLVANQKGKVTRFADYDPFGSVVGGKPSRSLSPGFGGLFTDSGLQLTLARSYTSDLGAFLQPDPQMRIPSESPESLSVYAYCGNDPINFVDDNGAERTLAENQRNITYGVAEMQRRNAETQRMINNRLAEMSRRNAEMQREIRFRMERMSRRQARSQAEMSRRLEEMRRRQSTMQSDSLRRHEEMVRRMRRQSSGVGQRQLLAANRFRDDFLYIWPRTLVAEGLNVYGNIFSSLGLFPVGELMKIGRDSIIQRIGARVPGAQVGIEIQAKETDAFVGLIDNIKTLWNVLRAFDLIEYRMIERKANSSKTFRGQYVVINTKDSADFMGNELIPPHITDNFIIRQTPLSEFRLNRDRLWDVAHEYAQKFLMDLERDVQKSTFSDLSPGYGEGNISTPTTLGGVYLGGAGKMIDGLGPIKGIHVDANNNLVLVAEDAGEVRLPPLRLDDVVTVFRSVYLHGEGPTVTIDPNPENPEKSAMIIRHGKATEDTYVGWILYQADRLMKGYTQGVDNKTKKEVVSHVPGYADILETIYFGGEDPGRSQKAGVWERFWIVPSEVDRFTGPRDKLTLFDVPLRVKTQKMKWADNQLVDDRNGKSSAGAMAFTSWFTNHYDDIAMEQYLLPPGECGITQPVPVFTELRRIALVTAIAEKLRDQGVPMPFWMRDYEVSRVPFERFTPGMEVTRKKTENNEIHTARIFGGVQLSAEDKAVKTFASAADIAKAPPEQKAEVVRNFQLAQRLEECISDRVSPVQTAPFSAQVFMDGKKSFKAVSVPGARSRALNPCRLDEVDLIVPLAGGRTIQLVRRYNSFFDPKGMWGKGWTMDLPRLVRIPIPVGIEDGKTSYRIGYDLVTPLHTSFARFREIRPVKEIGGNPLLVPEETGPFYGLADAQPDFLEGDHTSVLLLKDGREWHFTGKGELVAIVDGPQTTIFDRGTDGRVVRIASRFNGVPAAQIDLAYTREGRLAKAIGRSPGLPGGDPVEVSFAYDDSGRLARRLSEDGMIGYGYKGSLVTSVTWTEDEKGAKPETLQAFDYNGQGQLVHEKRGTREIRREMTAVADGIENRIGEGGDGQADRRVRYDDRMRPVERFDSDGTHTEWSHKENGEVGIIVTMPDNRKIVVRDSADRRIMTVSADGLPTFEVHRNAGGKLTSFSTDGNLLLEQEWRPDGQLAKAETQWQEILAQYSGHGLLTAIAIRPSNPEKKNSVWQTIRLDHEGAPVQIKDQTGLDLQFGYDEDGALTNAIHKTPAGDVGYQVQRDEKGRLEAIESSWGNLQCDYGSDYNLEKITVNRGDKIALIEIDGGTVKRRMNFDGGETFYAYNREDDAEGLLRGINLPNDLSLSYEYDDSGQLSSVAVGQIRFLELGHDDQGRVSWYRWKPIDQNYIHGKKM